MRRPAAALLLLGTTAYLAFLLASAPAALLRGWLPPDLPVSLGRLDGTLWHGAAQPLTAGPLRLETLRWRLRPWALAAGRLRLRLRAEGTTLQGRGTVQLSREALDASDVSLETALAPWIRRFAPALPLRGRLRSRNLGFGFTRTALQAAHGTVDIVHLSSGNSPVGDYRVTLAGEGGAIRGRLSTLAGPLRLRGVIRVSGGDRWVLDATARGGADLAPGVMEALALAGRRQSDGSVRFHRRGTLRDGIRALFAH